MAMNRSVIWVDAGGSAVITLIRTSTGAGGIQSAMLAQMNADYLNWWESAVTVNGAPAPTTAQYQAANQQARLVFLCADGTYAQLKLPAPKFGIFLPDGVSVDSTAIPALIAACVGTLEAPSGSLATSFVSGTLQRPP